MAAGVIAEAGKAYPLDCDGSSLNNPLPLPTPAILRLFIIADDEEEEAY